MDADRPDEPPDEPPGAPIGGPTERSVSAPVEAPVEGEIEGPPRRSRLRTLVRRLAIGLVVLLVLASGLGYAGYRTLPQDDVAVTDPGALIVAPAALGSHRTAGVQLQVTEGRLEVRSRGGDEDRLVWANPAGRAFLSAGAGDVAWEEHRGYFWPTVDLQQQWTDQRIESVEATDDRIVVRGTLAGGDGTVPFEVRLWERRAGGVFLDARVSGDVVDVVGFSSGRTADAGVHGFGEQFDDFDLSGRLIPIVVREQGVGRGLQPLTFLADTTQHGAGGNASMTYAALPTFVTDDLRGVRLRPGFRTSTAFAVADTREPRRVGLDVWARHLRLELTAAPTPQALVAEQVGNPSYPRLAAWTQRGLIVGVQGGTARVREVVDRLLAAGVELAGVWVQDWSGPRTTEFGERLWWTWQLDADRYPGWGRLVADLREQGIRTTTYVNPFLVDPGDRPGRNLLREARDKGFLVRDDTGGAYELDQGGFSAYLVDLTNPQARRWYAEVIAGSVLADGVVGFMADFAEGLPMDAVLHTGAARRLHNRWPGLWARTVRQACELAEQPDCVVWFRAGSPGMAELTPMFWNGDQLVRYGAHDGLASALLGTFHAGLSGWPLVHADLGGYTSVDAVVEDYVRSPELLQRWGEVAAYGVMMRSHEGNRPARNRQVYDVDELAGIQRNSRIFAALAPYRERVLREARETGVPAVRHTWLNHPNSAAAAADEQFFLGDSILVAPVLREGRREVEVTFPPGIWQHLFTGERFRGGQTETVAAPLGVPAAFAEIEDPALDEVRGLLREAGLAD